jgi:hypothetical protein
MRQLESVALHAEAAGRFYQEVARTRHSEFWHKRSAAADRTENNLTETERPALTILTKVQLAPGVSLKTVPTIRGDYIEPSTAIIFPGARRAITFLDGIEVGPLVAIIQRPITVEHIVRAWTQQIPYDHAKRIIGWLWETGVICSPALT